MTGTPQQLKSLVRKYKVFFSEPTEEDIESGDYIVDHSIATFMFDPQAGLLWGGFFVGQLSTEDCQSFGTA